MNNIFTETVQFMGDNNYLRYILPAQQMFLELFFSSKRMRSNVYYFVLMCMWPLFVPNEELQEIRRSKIFTSFGLILCHIYIPGS